VSAPRPERHPTQAGNLLSAVVLSVHFVHWFPFTRTSCFALSTRCVEWVTHLVCVKCQVAGVSDGVIDIPGTCVQYPGLQGGGARGDASTQGAPAGSMAAGAHGGTRSHAAVAGGAWGGERGAAAVTAAAAARRRGATPTGGAVTPPRSAPPRGGRGGRHGARAGGWDRPPRDGAPLTSPLDGLSNRRRAAATEAGAQARSPAVIVGASNPGSRCARSPRATRGGGGGRGAGAIRAL